MHPVLYEAQHSPAEIGSVSPELRHVRALILAGDLEATKCARQGGLEDQTDFFAFEMLLLGAWISRTLQTVRTGLAHLRT